MLDLPASAQDYYWRAMVELQLREPGAPHRAIALFEQALALEPRFAAAYLGIAYACRAAVFAREWSIDEAAAKGRVAVARALEIDRNLVEAYVVEAFLLTMQWRSIEAEVPLRHARAIAPDHVGVLTLTANLATYDGRPAVALKLRERLARLDPLSPLLYALWARDLATAGQFEEALAKSAEATAIDAEALVAVDVAVRIRVWYGRFADALQDFQARPRSSTFDLYARVAIVASHIAQGELDEAERVFAEFEPKAPEPPAYAEAAVALLWARGAYDDAVRWIEGEGRALVQEPWRGGFRAHSLALAGRRAEAVAGYRETFVDSGNRDLVAASVYPLHLGLSEIANWVVLEREQGGDGGEGLAYFESRIALMTAGGFGMPMLDYYRAVAAVLHGDLPAADAALGRAIAAGWLAPQAFTVDLVWRGVADEPWLLARRQQIGARIAAELARRTQRGGA